MSLWPAVLQAVQAAVDADALIQLTADLSPRKISRARVIDQSYDLGLDDAAADLYAALAPQSPLSPIIAKAAPGEVASVSSMVPPEQFARSDFWRDWVEPNGMADALIGPLVSNGAQMSVLNLMRARGHGRADFDADDEAVSRLIVPHVSRALSLNLRLAAADLRPNGVAADMLNALSTGVACLSDQGQVLWMNAAADRLLASRDGLWVDRERRLLASTHSGRAALIRMTAETARGRAAAANVERPSGRMALCLTATPLRGARRDDFASLLGARSFTVTALAIHEPDRDVSEGEDADLSARLQALYGLTPAEAVVATLIVRHRGLASVSEILGVARSTVHTHLRRAFHKMEAGSQAELARRLEALRLFDGP